MTEIMCETKSNIDLCKFFNVKENELFKIITNENECKICKIHNGELLEDVGYVKGQYYSPSYMTINDIAMIHN